MTNKIIPDSVDHSPLPNDQKRAQKEAEKTEQGLSESELIENDGRRKYFELRAAWSSKISCWIELLISFNIILTATVVYWVLSSESAAHNFRALRWFISTITIETFLQIVVMGHIAVKYLFSEHLKRK